MRNDYPADWRIIQELDDNLVAPVLKILGAGLTSDKWRWDAEGYYIEYCRQELYVNFDSRFNRVEIYRITGPNRGWGPFGGGNEPPIGTVSVKLPRKTWGNVRKKLRKILETA